MLLLLNSWFFVPHICGIQITLLLTSFLLPFFPLPLFVFELLQSHCCLPHGILIWF